MLERLFRVPWTARRMNQSTLKEVNPQYSLEGLMLKLKLQYFGHLMRRAADMVRQHHRPDGHESEQAPGDSEGQRSLACCSPQGYKELGVT